MGQGEVKCYECNKIIPLDDAILIKDEYDEEIELLVKLIGIHNDNEQGDFYVCVKCQDKLKDAIDKILGGKE